MLHIIPPNTPKYVRILAIAVFSAAAMIALFLLPGISQLSEENRLSAWITIFGLLLSGVLAAFIVIYAHFFLVIFANRRLVTQCDTCYRSQGPCEDLIRYAELLASYDRTERAQLRVLWAQLLAESYQEAHRSIANLQTKQLLLLPREMASLTAANLYYLIMTGYLQDAATLFEEKGKELTAMFTIEPDYLVNKGTPESEKLPNLSELVNRYLRTDCPYFDDTLVFQEMGICFSEMLQDASTGEELRKQFLERLNRYSTAAKQIRIRLLNLRLLYIHKEFQTVEQEEHKLRSELESSSVLSAGEKQHFLKMLFQARLYAMLETRNHAVMDLTARNIPSFD